MAEPSIPEGFDFTDPDLYVSRMPTEEFAELRRTAPVWWNAQPRGAYCRCVRIVYRVAAGRLSGRRAHHGIFAAPGS